MARAFAGSDPRFRGRVRGCSGPPCARRGPRRDAAASVSPALCCRSQCIPALGTGRTGSSRPGDTGSPGFSRAPGAGAAAPACRASGPARAPWLGLRRDACAGPSGRWRTRRRDRFCSGFGNAARDRCASRHLQGLVAGDDERGHQAAPVGARALDPRDPLGTVVDESAQKAPVAVRRLAKTRASITPLRSSSRRW